jgi:two-component system osmolarity sensor histidine kinase EnvZ
VDLAATARTTVSSFERTTDQLSLVAPASLEIPRANVLLVERLIANLVDNALKHGRPPVRVTVSTEPPSLTVHDAGDGLAPHQLEALQEAFQRGDSARAQAGSGLGLAIVRQVAARLGARLVFARDAQGQRVSVVWASGPGKGPQSPGPA